MRLSLGTPLVRLPARTANDGRPAFSQTPIVEVDPEPGGMSTALRVELDALLSETKHASTSVAAAVAATVPPRPGGGASPRPPSSWPGSPWQETLSVDVASLPFLRDHCFIRQPVGWEELSDLFPVVPMTTMVEMLKEAAERLAPELAVTRMERIRAFRWLTAAPATNVTITANRTGPFEVEVAIDGYRACHGPLGPLGAARSPVLLRPPSQAPPLPAEPGAAV